MATERGNRQGAARSLPELLAAYGHEPETAVAGKMAAYLALLEKWNARVNLTADTSWPAIGWLFEEALWAARWYREGALRHLDIGSGAGFPAVPLKILRPAMQLRLVESRARRAAFLETVAAELDLPGITVVASRVEDYLQSPAVPPLDVVSWKGIRLSRAALTLVGRRGGPDLRCWLFHGGGLPLADAASSAGLLRLVQREAFPGHANRWLSICAVSRETRST